MIGGTAYADISDPVGYWAFDESTGTVTADAGSGGNDGTFVNDDVAFVNDVDRGPVA